MGKRTNPDIDETISNLQHELVRRAAVEREEKKLDRPAPRSDEHPITATFSYFLMREAPNVVRGKLQPGDEPKFNLKPLEPDPDDASMTLADALARLALYREQENNLDSTLATIRAARAVSAGLRQLVETLATLREDVTPERRPDFAWLAQDDDVIDVLREAPRLQAVVDGIRERLESVLRPTSFWDRARHEREEQALWNTRNRLVTASRLSNPEIAELLAVGSASMKERTDRVRAARRRWKADGSSAATMDTVKDTLVAIRADGYRKIGPPGSAKATPPEQNDLTGQERDSKAPAG